MDVCAVSEASIFLGQGNIRQSLQMEAQQSEGNGLVDQGGDLADELPLIGHIGEHHADAESGALNHEPDRQPNGDDVLNPEDDGVRGALPDAYARHTDIGIDRIGQLCLPQGMTQCFAAK